LLVLLLRLVGRDGGVPLGEQEGPDGNAEADNAEEAEQRTKPQDAVGRDGEGRRRGTARVLDFQVRDVLDLRLALVLVFAIALCFGLAGPAVAPAVVIIISRLLLGGRSGFLRRGRLAAFPGRRLGGGFARGRLLLFLFCAGDDKDVVALGAAHFLAGGQRLGRLE